MEVEIVSRECVKPSSPTPHHLRTHKISLLDQYVPNTYGALLLFYPPNHQLSVLKTLQVLKQSLSETLTLYYPLAGKGKGNLSIDCNDEGAYYVEARVTCHLSDYLKQPDISAILKFMPEEILDDKITPGAHTCMVQVTMFACGGVAIAILTPHILLDGTALNVFVKTWARMAIGGGGAYQSPDFSASVIFPQNNAFPQDLTSQGLLSELVRKGKPTLRRFVFDGQVISKFKTQATSYGIQNPTRVEVVSAFLYNRVMSALRKEKSGALKSAIVANSVNLRRRASPPFAETCVGNFLSLMGFILKGEETDLVSFVRKKREALSRVDGDLVKSFQGDQGLRNYCEDMGKFRELNSKAVSDGAEQIFFNSWCNMGMYDADYGWGKPLWVPFLPMVRPFPVSWIQLMDTRRGSGIEAWLMLDEPVMSVLEHDKLLLSAAASLDPSPLQIGSPKSSL
ncbi:stemmadenine O-acetyltransferase-like [Tripterygium wilfordii]|uniref:stemmadenine O-acetyltransferase-like n=1 Tax=Tripterygium wilfordii TaxID=458696 RepID=UPI0018F848CE|nr:stemmadenine O-acetyltransferase-like [Tripterygium wilfordii]